MSIQYLLENGLLWEYYVFFSITGSFIYLVEVKFSRVLQYASLP